MKTFFLAMALLPCFSSFALTCTSHDDQAKKLQLNNPFETYVQGMILADKIDHLYVGTFKAAPEIDSLLTNYTLYNQHGKKHQFNLKEKISGGHFPCRARVCLNDHFITKVGKLIQEGQDDEYFDCI